MSNESPNSCGIRHPWNRGRGMVPGTARKVASAREDLGLERARTVTNGMRGSADNGTPSGVTAGTGWAMTIANTGRVHTGWEWSGQRH
jgi:hypothetical protein